MIDDDKRTSCLRFVLDESIGVQSIGQEGWFLIPRMKKHTTYSDSQASTDIAAVRDEVRRAVALIGGKWKLEILWLLNQRIHRFNELRRAVPGVTQHMLTAQLRELETDGLVRRTVFPEVPPRVEYEITSDALRLKPVFTAIVSWANERRSARRRSRA